jgi:hypothetical protein
MPRHPVVNRRNLSPFVRKLVSVTEEAYDQATQLAAALEVSTGSIVDTALRQLAGTDPDQVLELMRAHGHLTDAEYAYVRDRRAAGVETDAKALVRRGTSTRRAKVTTTGTEARTEGRPT